MSSLMILGVILVGLTCGAFLWMASLYFFFLRRLGPNIDTAGRLWLQLRIIQYVLLLAIVVMAVAGAPKWSLYGTAGAWLVLVVAASRVRRRIGDPPASPRRA
jgi:hypothetical protein